MTHQFWGQVFAVPFHGVCKAMVQAATQPKITHFTSEVVLPKEDISRFDVQVTQPVIMQMLQTLQSGKTVNILTVNIELHTFTKSNNIPQILPSVTLPWRSAYSERLTYKNADSIQNMILQISAYLISQSSVWM